MFKAHETKNFKLLLYIVPLRQPNLIELLVVWACKILKNTMVFFSVFHQAEQNKSLLVGWTAQQKIISEMMGWWGTN